MIMFLFAIWAISAAAWFLWTAGVPVYRKATGKQGMSDTTYLIVMWILLGIVNVLNIVIQVYCIYG